jgi:hypothetical protein
MTPLVVFAIALTAGLAAYLLAGHEVSPLFEGLGSVGWCLLVVLWVDADARRRRRLPCYDFGFLAYVFFPLSVAWYCLWSRGWRGLLLLAALLALYMAPYALSALLWQALYGRS